MSTNNHQIHLPRIQPRDLCLIIKGWNTGKSVTAIRSVSRDFAIDKNTLSCKNSLYDPTTTPDTTWWEITPAIHVYSIETNTYLEDQIKYVGESFLMKIQPNNQVRTNKFNKDLYRPLYKN